MKKVLLIVLGLFAVVIGGIVIAAATRSPLYHVERSVTTTATPGAAYLVLCDFNRYPEWSPFLKLDPAAKTTVTGDKCQVGHHYAWSGNDEAGEGSMTIASLTPDDRIDVALAFIRPMPSTAKVTYTTRVERGQTVINWAMDGEFTSLGEKIFGMLFMDKVLGQMFDEGLATVKTLAEKGSY